MKFWFLTFGFSEGLVEVVGSEDATSRAESATSINNALSFALISLSRRKNLYREYFNFFKKKDSTSTKAYF
jgi:hypothetical protein